MLEAVLRGKLSVSLAAEDALTAVVFELLHFAPWETALGPWLATATALDGSRTLVLPSSAPTVKFWPTFPERDGSVCEPDVLIEWQGGEQIVVECKLDSPPSGDPSDAVAVTGQLGRQWIAACDARPMRAPLALLYVTRHWTTPRETLEGMVAEVERKHSDMSMRPSMFWLSWRGLIRSLEGSPVADATAERLKTRVTEYVRSLGLVCFAGLPKAPTEAPPVWGYQGGRR